MHPLPSVLNSIAVVLVRPESPGNVGAVARIIRNFGLGPLRIVGEPLQTEPEAKRLAHRSLGILQEARVYPDLTSALAGCGWVVATSGRVRRRGPRPIPIRSAVSRLVWQAEGGPGALVFGPESDGLSLGDLARCDEVIRIPQRTSGPALNLAQAVAIFGAELFYAALLPGTLAPPPMVAREEVDRVVRRMVRLARHCGLPVRNRPEEMSDELRRVFTDHAYTPYELAVVELWLAQIEWFVGLRPALPERDS